MTVLSVIRRGRIPQNIEEEMVYQSALFVEYVKEDRASQGEQLNYSQESLQIVDLIIDEFRHENRILGDREHMLISAYAFETARAHFGGEYKKAGEEVANDLVDPYFLLFWAGASRVRYAPMSAISTRTVSDRQASVSTLYERMRRRVLA